MSDKPRVIYIDDNPQNLQSFKAAFRRDFDVFAMMEQEEAFALIAKENIQIVISDYKMPGLMGTYFLEQVKIRYPETVRIMLTGHADLPAVIEAINRSEIFRFLGKPWNESELKKAIWAAYDLYRTRIDLVQANADLSKAYNELDQMVYSTAHDITGPLANILGLVDLVRRDPGATEEYLLLVEKAVRKLQLIAKEVINFHRNKRTPVEQQSINFKKLIENAIQDYAFFEGAEEIDFDIQIHANSPFESDKERLKIIFNNLISNAIKYRDRHKDVQKVEILVSTDALGAHITVSDNGLGIAEEVIPRIFDIYYRASAQSTGSGIGLYIVREVITLLSGKIEVSSIDGTGTTFRLFIPRTNTSGESK
jgi:signal transduction histidine kinase